MNDKLKNILIGFFVLGAFAIIAFMLLFLHPTVGDDAKRFRIRFADIDKVTMGTRVNYAGRAVGEVVSIHEIEDSNNPRQAIDGYIYLYEVIIAVDSAVEIFNSDQLFLRTSGLLGEKSVAITPLPPKPGQPLRELNFDDVIFAHETGSVEETLKEFKELSDKFEEALDSINHIAKSITREKIVENAGKTVSHLASIAETLDDPERLKSILAKAESSLSKAENFLSDGDDALKKVDLVLDKVKKGEGTLGRLLMRDDLYLRINSVLSKGETLMDDMNHYGLLFHSDKGWQRTRARRANLLVKLESPVEFRNYFNDEIDDITTALSRVNLVVEKANALPYFYCREENVEFKKVFSELLRRVKMMEESLDLYNQGLMECVTEKTEPCYNR